MNRRLRGKVAIVTGAGRGIGRSEALALAAEGAKVLVNDNGSAIDGNGFSELSADRVVEEIKGAGGEAVANYDTVATPVGGEQIIMNAITVFGSLDILINNAGNNRKVHFCDMTEQDWDEVIKVHLYGHFNCSRAACVWFRKRWYETGRGGGRIINTSSLTGLSCSERSLGPGFGITMQDLSEGKASYGAAKQGILGLTRVVALDMSRYGVTCNAIVPSAYTRMTATTISEEKEGVAGSGFSKIETLSTESIATFVAYLATDEAAYINGLVFRVMEGQIGVYGNDNPYPISSIYKKGKWNVDELCEILPTMLEAALRN